VIPPALAARLEATARSIGSPDAPASPYASAPQFRCAGCGCWPLGGFDAGQDLDAVIAKSTALGVAVWGYLDGELRPWCGENCLRYHQSEAARGNRGAATRLDVRVPAQSMGPAKTVQTGVGPATFEERIAKSVCVGCGDRHELDQRREAGADWMPDERTLLEHAGWQFALGGARYCSRTCALRAGAPDPSGVIAPVAVDRVADVSYQASRPHQAPKLELAAREVGESGKPARRPR
jgi:hypothetical protein